MKHLVSAGLIVGLIILVGCSSAVQDDASSSAQITESSNAEVQKVEPVEKKKLCSDERWSKNWLSNVPVPSFSKRPDSALIERGRAEVFYKDIPESEVSQYENELKQAGFSLQEGLSSYTYMSTTNGNTYYTRYYADEHELENPLCGTQVIIDLKEDGSLELSIANMSAITNARILENLEQGPPPASDEVMEEFFENMRNGNVHE